MNRTTVARNLVRLAEELTAADYPKAAKLLKSPDVPIGAIEDRLDSLRENWKRVAMQQRGLEKAGAGSTEAPGLIEDVLLPQIDRLMLEIKNVRRHLERVV